ncbi:UPF0147 family protein [Candidatus Woesearchaeota archaeon]|nr:UPF0147 family protein [Candidatus Woesearchaeota archaeon]
MTTEQVHEIIEFLKELIDDDTTQKNVRLRLTNAIDILENGLDLHVSIHKALNELDELTDSPSMASYTRSKIFTVVSLLESIPC